MVQAEATARYIRSSAQKAGLVLDLIRGRAVNHALATLKYTKKSVARDIAKVLESAIANAQLKEGFGGDVDRRDQVLMTFFSPARFMTSTFSRSGTSTNGPFFSDLDIVISTVSGPLFRSSLDLYFDLR